MLNEFVPWLIGSAPYFLLLTLGISYSVLRAVRNPRFYRWTIAALAMALLAWILRPFLTDWPRLLEDRFPDWLMYHSFASGLLDIAPIGLLIWTLTARPRDQICPRGNLQLEPTNRASRVPLPRWVWLVIGGVLILILLQTVASLLEFGKLDDISWALAGVFPCLLFVWWIRHRVLSQRSNSVPLSITNWALVAWLIAWIVGPVLLVGPFSIDHEHPMMRVLVSSLCSGVPIGLLSVAVLGAEADTAAREALTRQARSSFGQLLWLCLGGIVGAIVAAVLFVVGLVVYLNASGSMGGGHGAWPGPGFDELLLGTPLALLLGFLVGGVVAALKLRGHSSLRKLCAIGGALYLAILGGIYAWNKSMSPTQTAIGNYPEEQQSVIALLYELRAVQPSHMKTQPLFARDMAEIEAELDAYGTAAVPALITALDDWQIHHFAAQQLGKLRDPRAIPPLIDFLVNPRGMNPYFVNEALQQFDDLAVAAAVAEMERQPLAAEITPGQTGDPLASASNSGVVEKLIAILKEQDEAFYHRRFEAIQALTTLGDPRAIDALYALLDDETAKEQDLRRQERAEGALLRPSAAAAVGRLKDARAYETLTRLIETDENVEVRAGAIRGIGGLGDKRAIPLLQRVAAGKVTPATPTPPNTELDWFVVENAAEQALRELQSR